MDEKSITKMASISISIVTKRYLVLQKQRLNDKNIMDEYREWYYQTKK